MRKLLLIMFLACCSIAALNAQQLGVKTNALYWASATTNLGLEVGLGKKTTIELTGGYNPWTFNSETNRKMKHWMVMPEFRYWLCERFNGHFFGVHTGYTFFNISGVPILPWYGSRTKENRYQGWGTGVGIAYGYQWVIGKRWNIEATIGAGYIYSNYDRYECMTCGKFKGTDNYHYFGPTKLGISVIYLIK